MPPTFIRHRVNRIAEIAALEPGWGAEIDLRSSVNDPGRIHLAHDPWIPGDDFESWLNVFQGKQRGPLILNTKEDGLEARARELVFAAGIEHYFFLDTTLPTLVKEALREGRNHFAVRVSKVEPLSGVDPFRGKVRWAWLDCFHGDPLPVEIAEALAPDFQLCLVSPELQGQPLEALSRFKALAQRCSAICTKRPDAWQQLL